MKLIPVWADVIAATPETIVWSAVRPWLPVLLLVIAAAAVTAVMIRSRRK